MARQLHTTIHIDVPADRAWVVLTDWHAYPDWNPWMTRLSGVLEPGAPLDVRVHLGSRPIDMAPTLIDVEPGRSFRWLGRTGLPWIFDGEHRFTIEPTGAHSCRFVHGETFRGVLVESAFLLLAGPTLEGFVAMNRAFKQRCESSMGSDPSIA